MHGKFAIVQAAANMCGGESEALKVAEVLKKAGQGRGYQGRFEKVQSCYFEGSVMFSFLEFASREGS
eukprot:2738696-Alexandrium_andersonii.AAC.1